MDETVYTTRASSRRRRRRRARQRRAAAARGGSGGRRGVLVWHFFPRPYYTARQLGITQIQSPLDANGDGVDDYTDMLFGARDYIATKPYYKSAYYVGGYPNDGTASARTSSGRRSRPPGTISKDLVDRDILAAPSAYPNVAAPDPNIDFRRVTNLDAYLRRHAQVLTCSLDDPAQWQPGDIVVFGDMDHIGICSDRRNRSGVPFLIHHGNPGRRRRRARRHAENAYHRTLPLGRQPDLTARNRKKIFPSHRFDIDFKKKNGILISIMSYYLHTQAV